MDKKPAVIIGILLAALIAGGLILAYRGQNILESVFGSARKSFIEIKPRITADTAQANVSLPAAGKEKSGKKETEAKVPAVRWCLPENAASVSGNVIINEVAWMGTMASYSDEWIELKNISGDTADLSGWQLMNKKGTVKIAFGGEARIAPGGFFLLERTDDFSVPEVKAGAIYTGGLANTKEALFLFDRECRIADSVAAFPAWPAGDNTTKKTMERRSGGKWQTSVYTGGTPGAENSMGIVVPRPLKP